MKKGSLQWLREVVGYHDPGRTIFNTNFFGLDSVCDKEISYIHVSSPLAA
jgi:hypothetical protein